MSLFGTRETYGGGDYSWVGPGTDLTKAETGTLDAAAFTNKTVESGTPVYRDENGICVPWSDQNPAGLRFVVHPQSVEDGDGTCALLWFGNIKVKNLPVEFDPVAGALFAFDGALPVIDETDSNGGGE